MSMVHAAHYYCSKCNSIIDFEKSFVEHGDLVAVCSTCKTKQTLDKGIKCDRCSDIAIQVKWVHNAYTTSGKEVLTPIYRCVAHPINGAFLCTNCGALLQHELISLKDGNLMAECIKCNTEIVIKTNVKCEKYAVGPRYIEGTRKPVAPCTNQATHFAWEGDPGSDSYSGLRIPYFKCDEHRDEPPASKQQRIRTGIIHLLIAVGCCVVLAGMGAIFPEPTDHNQLIGGFVLFVVLIAGVSLVSFFISGLYNLIKGLTQSK